MWYCQGKISKYHICPIHGEFQQIASNHITGSDCPKCANIKLSKTTQQFIIDANHIHRNRYEYSCTKYVNSKVKVEILCPIHGIFKQTPNRHLSGDGCPKCSITKGERSIENYLLSHNIKYNYEYKFTDCTHINELRFDFYLPELNICIEYDGEQHYRPITYFGGEKSFRQTQTNDNIKSQYCITNNIKLIRIPYWDFKNIHTILGKEL